MRGGRRIPSPFMMVIKLGRRSDTDRQGDADVATAFFLIQN
jgi:hypothetical protein